MDVFNISDYPLLDHYRHSSRRLTREEAAVADFDTRFASVGRFLVGQAIRFHSAILSREGKVSHDPEDIFLDLWHELRRRNHKYMPERGEYLTFVQRVVMHKLSEILEQVHCVHCPANASEKYKVLLAQSKTRELTANESGRLSALIAANVDHAPLSAGSSAVDRKPQPPDEAVENERGKLSSEAINLCLSHLSTRECLAIGYHFGLWNRQKMYMSHVDIMCGLEHGTMGKALTSAKRKLRKLCLRLRLDSSWV